MTVESARGEDATPRPGMGFTVDFRGFSESMRVNLEGGASVELWPWRLGDHLAALRGCVSVKGDSLVLDREAFAKQVLSASGIYPEQHDLVDLALFWAAGADGDPPVVDPSGWIRIGKLWFRLRPWTEGERQRALAEHVQTSPERGLDVVGYLSAMITCTVVERRPAGSLSELDSGVFSPLIDAVLELNVPEGGLETELVDGEQARSVLKLCAALGWTPSKVLTTPAVEVRRLLALVDAAGGVRAEAPTRRGGLASHPDAIVIHVEDDAE